MHGAHGHGCVTREASSVNGWGGAVRGRSEQNRNAPPCQMRNHAKCGIMPNIERGVYDFPNAERRRYGAENKPCCRQVSGYVSNVIYHDYIDYCIRHFI